MPATPQIFHYQIKEGLDTNLNLEEEKTNEKMVISEKITKENVGEINCFFNGKYQGVKFKYDVIRENIRDSYTAQITSKSGSTPSIKNFKWNEMSWERYEYEGKFYGKYTLSEKLS